MNGLSEPSKAVAKLPSVYVNDQECTLLADYRLALYQYFREGTQLYDPAYTPPRRLIVGADGSDEYGVTLRKLLPESRYHAFFENSGVGVPCPVSNYTCVYLTNLPPHTTPEMLGRFFEMIDLIKEADVFRGRHSTCDGRGWVVFQDPSKLAMVAPVLEFCNQMIYAHLSDQEPPRKVSPPPGSREPQSSGSSVALPVPRGAANRPPPPPLLGSSDGSPSSPTSPIGIATNLPQPRSSRVGAVPPRSASGFGLPASAGTTLPPPPPPPPPPSGSSPVGESGRVPPLPRSSLAGAAPRRLNVRSFFYTCFIAESDLTSSVAEGVFRPLSHINEEELFAAVEARNEVFLIMLLDYHAAVFGVARLLPATRRRNRGLPVEWLSHGVYLKEAALRSAGGFSLLRARDGVAIKADIGARICEIAEASPSLPHMPDSLPLYPGPPLPPHGAMASGTGGRGRGGGGSPGAAAGPGFAAYTAPHGGPPRGPPPPASAAARKSTGGPFVAHSKSSVGPPKAVGDSPPAGPAIPIPASKRHAAAASASPGTEGPAPQAGGDSGSKGIKEIPKPASAAAKSN